MGKAGIKAGYLATAAIGGSFVLSMAAFAMWLNGHGSDLGHSHHGATIYYTGDWYSLAEIGNLKLTIGYYIDALTIGMFCMVTLIATCIHFYAQGYMHDELHEFTDPEVTTSSGGKFTRPGRYHRFFQYMSLFCFSMLGVVISGNLAMTFVFWELVGICSYFLIGFYIERKSASTAANKAFIVNRVGDFGMLIGLMAIWASLGTFNFGDVENEEGQIEPGIFSLMRPAEMDGHENHHALIVPDGMVRLAARDEIAGIVAKNPQEPKKAEKEIAGSVADWRTEGVGYCLLIVAGLGIFCGCVGKSAQFPLHTWLPDAMEGPTPVSALVHSATMVAAGVFLVGRFYPVFAPEVLLVIASVGCITLFMAATIAITATDIKRVLAYSTVSQLGYMMLALGVGGWMAGLFHLITHAFFKSLLFMCSGSVIHAVHTNEMTEMGGLRKKMPYTAYTMLIGCMAISGAGIPFVIGFSGFHSKDAIIAQALNFSKANSNPLMSIFYYAAAAGAAITAFYMFRLWYMTFSGKPRNQHRYDHAHESPKVMYVPLIVLAVFAVGVGWNIPGPSVQNLLEQARPAGTVEIEKGVALAGLTYPNEHHAHPIAKVENETETATALRLYADGIHTEANIVAFSTALAGFLLATMFYGLRKADPTDVRQQFARTYRFLINKWWFDELYDTIFVRPVLVLAKIFSWFDKTVLDGIIDGSVRLIKLISRIDNLIDQLLIDGLVNLVARWTYDLGASLRSVQSGKLSWYVMAIVVGTVSLFVMASFVLKSMAG
jgi:NADH-quinone oxidoreductase subunit L